MDLREYQAEVVDMSARHRRPLIVAPCGYGVVRAAAEGEMQARKKEWAWLAHRRVWAMDSGGLLSRPGPRLVDGVETLAEIFHPSVFLRPSRTRALELRIA